MRPRSIRARLMLWHTAILAAIVVAFAAVVYFTVRSTLEEQLDDGLANRALLIERLMLEREAPVTAGDDDVFVRAFTPAGDLDWDAHLDDDFDDVRVDEAALRDAAEGSSGYETLDASEGSVRVLTQPVRREGEIVGIVQVGESTDDLDETVRQLTLVLALAVPGALALAALGGWWLSSRALAPIDRVTRTAADISGGGDLSRRLDLDLPDDEAGRLARTFDAMIARLDAAFARQRQFTSDASHELRTPLTAIRGQIDVALERPRDPAEYQRVLAAVNAQVERLTRLSDALLLLARSEGGATRIPRERLDVRELVESVAEQVRPLAEQKGLGLRVDDGGAAAVEGDEDLLLQLLLNLADNAIKYTQSGAVTLGWRPRGDSVEVFVRDTGPGVAEAERERVFERFYRGDASRSRQEGAGLGLAIARWIAEAHGGALSVASDNGGSTFTLTLPAA